MAPYVVPNTIQCPLIDDKFINFHNWETNDIKSNGFDQCELYTIFQIKNNLGADTGIIPMFHDKNDMPDFNDKNCVGELLLWCLSLSHQQQIQI